MNNKTTTQDVMQRKVSKLESELKSDNKVKEDDKERIKMKMVDGGKRKRKERKRWRRIRGAGGIIEMTNGGMGGMGGRDGWDGEDGVDRRDEEDGWDGRDESERQIEMLTEARQMVVNQGDNVSMQCVFRVNFGDFNLFSYPIHWKKTQLNEQVQVSMGS